MYVTYTGPNAATILQSSAVLSQQQDFKQLQFVQKSSVLWNKKHFDAVVNHLGDLYIQIRHVRGQIFVLIVNNCFVQLKYQFWYIL